MASPETDTQSLARRHWWPRAVAIAAGIGFIAPGVWAFSPACGSARAIPSADYLFIGITVVVVILLFLPVTRRFFSR